MSTQAKSGLPLSEVGQGYWGFPVYQESLERFDQVLGAIEEANQGGRLDSAALNQHVGELVKELTDAGLDAYYHNAVSLMSLSGMLRRSADSGINVIRKAIHYVISSVFKKRDADEIKAITTYLRTLLHAFDGHQDDESEEVERLYLKFPIAPPMFEKILALLERVRVDSDTQTYEHEIIAIMTEMSQSGVDYYYRQPKALLSVGRLTSKATDAAIGTVEKTIASLIPRFVEERSHQEMLAMGDYIESLIHAK